MKASAANIRRDHFPPLAERALWLLRLMIQALKQRPFVCVGRRLQFFFPFLKQLLHKSNKNPRSAFRTLAGSFLSTGFERWSLIKIRNEHTNDGYWLRIKIKAVVGTQTFPKSNSHWLSFRERKAREKSSMEVIKLLLLNSVRINLLLIVRFYSWKCMTDSLICDDDDYLCLFLSYFWHAIEPWKFL